MIYVLQNYFYVYSFIVPWGESVFIWGKSFNQRIVAFEKCKYAFYENVLTLLSSSFRLSFVIGISMSLIITCT